MSTWDEACERMANESKTKESERMRLIQIDRSNGSETEIDAANVEHRIAAMAAHCKVHPEIIREDLRNGLIWHGAFFNLRYDES